MAFYTIQFNSHPELRAWKKQAGWTGHESEFTYETPGSIVFSSPNLPDFKTLKDSSPFIYSCFKSDSYGNKV